MSSRAAAALVSALADLQARQIELARSLRAVPAIANVSHALGPRRLRGGDLVESYVEAALRNGNFVVMWLEFRWEDGEWLVESSIRHNTDAGDDELLGLPMRYAVDDEELFAELEGAAKALVAAAGNLDFDAL